CIFAAFRHFGFERRQPVGTLNIQKSCKNSHFWVCDFLRSGFLARQDIKRSKSYRIYEYFNEVLAEIRP
ncbi:MAG: hypothetical protein IKJ27_09535, partial [Clostridia bacterium]|nr:hypothetical protein [Clostridia bacterium]